MVLAAVGGLSGLALGTGIAGLLHVALPALPVRISLPYIIITELVAVPIELAAGATPALRAAQMDPVEALRAE